MPVKHPVATGHGRHRLPVPHLLCVAMIAAACAMVPVRATAQTKAPDRGTRQPIPDHIWQAMQNRSWHAGLPCPARNRLTYLKVPYRDFRGARRMGELIVARDVADRLLDAFAEIYRSGFRIARMELVHKYGGDDNRSMAANNTSAFNCRTVTGKKTLSQHSYGRAIDINPVQNPYVWRRGTQPPAGRDFDSPQERRSAHPGIIRHGGPVTRAFRRIGWKWGGNWRSSKDYQHFSANGR